MGLHETREAHCCLGVQEPTRDKDIVYAAPTDEIPVHDPIRVGLRNIAKIVLREQATEVGGARICGPARDSLTPVALQHSVHSIFVRSNLLAIGEALSTAYMILILGLNSS